MAGTTLRAPDDERDLFGCTCFVLLKCIRKRRRRTRKPLNSCERAHFESHLESLAKLLKIKECITLGEGDTMLLANPRWPALSRVRCFDTALFLRKVHTRRGSVAYMPRRGDEISCEGGPLTTSSFGLTVSVHFGSLLQSKLFRQLYTCNKIFRVLFLNNHFSCSSRVRVLKCIYTACNL